MTQNISIYGHFMAAHRLQNYNGKCKNLHGHNYKYQITVSFDEVDPSTGFAIDFGDLKRMVKNFLDSMLDHKTLINPADKSLIEFCKTEQNEYYMMQRTNNGFCNTTAENISIEMFIELEKNLQKNVDYLKLEKVTLWETESTSVECTGSSRVN